MNFRSKRSLAKFLIGAVMLTCSAARADAPYSEPLRPQFHFTSTTDWLNDPNGLVFYDGEYHLFFQRNPGHTDFGSGIALRSWGHAISTDLVHWQQLPDAISPDEAGSIWSGSAVVDWTNTSGLGIDGRPPLVAAYANAKDPFDQRLAYSTDRGRTWTKFAGNPVLGNVLGHNRDPKLVWHEPTKHWIMALHLDQAHRFALFASPDLKAWTKLQEVTLDYDDECPDFFPINLDGDTSKTKWVFTAASGHYIVGSFDGHSFTPETDSTEMERGPNFYAAQTFSDIPASDGRRIQIGWMRDGKYPGMPFNQQMSFPSEMTLRSTSRGLKLFRWPVKEIESLYGPKHEWHDVSLKQGEDLLGGLSGELFDITTDIEVGKTTSITLNIRGMPITFHTEGNGGALTCWDRRVSLPLLDGRFKLRVLVDRTSIEIFANDGATVLSGCFLPEENQRAITLTDVDDVAKVRSLVVYELTSAWTAK